MTRRRQQGREEVFLTDQQIRQNSNNKKSIQKHILNSSIERTNQVLKDWGVLFTALL